MPRYIFPASSVTNTTGAPIRLAFHYTQTGGVRASDLWTVDGSNYLSAGIPNGIVLTTTAGAYSAFAGPDDVDTLWVTPHTGAARTQITATGYVAGETSLLNSTFATLASPTLTGIPAAPDAATGSTSHQIATAARAWAGDQDAPIGPALVVPPGIAPVAVATWPANNQYMVMRFSLTAPRTYRYINLRVGVQSGNIQAGVASITADNIGTLTLTRIAHTGSIACPASGDNRLDLGNTYLPPGDYGLFLWCDNTTATLATTGIAGAAAARTYLGTTIGGGIPSGDTVSQANTRYVYMTLESPQFSVYALGDSITDGGYATWFAAVNNATNRFVVTDAGVAGNTTTQMVARLAADVTAHTPNYVTVLGGTNDISQSFALSTTTTNLASIYSAITAAGGKVVACTVLPRSAPNSTAALSASDASKLQSINAWIRANYSSYSGAKLCDWSYAMSTGDETSPNPAYFQVDLVHPTATGHGVMAPYLRRAMSSWA